MKRKFKPDSLIFNCKCNYPNEVYCICCGKMREKKDED